MSSYEMFSARGAADTKLARPIELICFALIVANAIYLADSYLQGSWLLEPDGTGIVTDFVTLWSAGHLALAGHAAAAYDWATLKLVDESALGRSFDGYLGWPYPPTFLFAVAPLALLPYLGAFLLWVFGTFVAYVVAIRAVIGDRAGYFLAAAFPAVLANFVVGQNGFLSAALIGGALVFMERRPIAAGVLLGLLSYKPHLGVLFPIVLLASGHWRVFVSATIVAVLMAVASYLFFGSDSWQAFLSGARHTLTADGAADWGKLQTAFGLTRALGGGATLAWIVQIAVALVAAVANIVLWRSSVAYEIKAAALATGALLATSHLLMYDLAVLAVPLGFLFRLGWDRGFLPHEMAGMGVACLAIMIFPFVAAPVGFVAVLVVGGLIVNRALTPHGVAA